MAVCPTLDPAEPLQFVINAAAGSSDADAKREVIEAALRAGGRRGDLLFCSPAELTGVAQQAARKAIANRTAVVAVGGDGTLNTVAQAAHAVGCAMGVVPQGTFNYFARKHGIPNSVNLLRWGQASDGSEVQAQNESEAGDCCLIERWDFAGRDRGFVRTAVTTAQVERV